MAVKRRDGTKGKPIVERMLTVFYLHFPTPAVEAMSRIYACKTERNLQIFGWCLQFKQPCPWATLPYFCLQNKAGKIYATRRVILRKCVKRAQRYQFSLKCEEVPLQIEFTTLPPKNHNLFVKLWTKRELEKKELQPQANNAQYNTQGGGGCEKRVRGGAGGSFTQTYIWAGWNSMTLHTNFQLWLKRGFFLRWSISEGQQKPGDVAEAARLQVIMLTAPLTLRASYLPLPPFSSSPFSHRLPPLSPSACYTAHGIQGCFKTTSFDKNYWHFNFAINPSCPSFSSLLFSRTFFAIPLAEKMHLLFLLTNNPKSFLPLFPLLQFFTPLNKLCQLFISKELKPPC